MTDTPPDSRFPDGNEVENDDKHTLLLEDDTEAYKRWHFSLPLPRRLAMDVRLFESDALGFALLGDGPLWSRLRNWLHRNDYLDSQDSPLPRDETPPDCDDLLADMRCFIERLEWPYRCAKKDLRSLLKELQSKDADQWGNEVAETLDQAYVDLRCMALSLPETIGARDNIEDLQSRLVAFREKVGRLSHTLDGFRITLRSPSLEAAIGALKSDPISQVLRKLDECKVSPIDDLPPRVDINVLRCLDRDGMIEVRMTHMQNMKLYPGDPAPHLPMKGRWFSPIAHPEQAGDWDQIMAQTLRDARHVPPEIRLSERGRAKLWEQQSGKPTDAASKPGGEPTKPDPTDLIALNVAADLFDVEPKTIREWIKKDWLPVYGADRLPSQGECRKKIVDGKLPKRRRAKKNDTE